MGRKKKRRSAGTSNLARLKEEFEARPEFNHFKISTATDGKKMSAVLLDFVGPYKYQTETKAAFEKLLVVAIVAWNASLMARAARQKLINDVRATIVRDAGEESGRDFDQIVKLFMIRKARYFADNRRQIIDFRVVDTGREFRVAVISTMPDRARLSYTKLSARFAQSAQRSGK